MKNYKIWGALLIVVILVILILTRVIDIPPDNGDTPEEMMSSLKCTTCHGTDLAGTDKGPALHNLKEYWTKDDLVKYLMQPISFIDEPRLVKYQEKYEGYIMPAYDTVNVEKLGMIADYLLEK
ncbi:MAG TPA: c-type cytochrome [Ignavibacteriaceae bacterium]|nr:c-type cytochrome [Ignavibacteriaceae bacterium]